MQTEAKILRLADMVTRDAPADLVEAYAMSILRDKDTAGGLPNCGRGIVRDLRGLHDALVTDAPNLAPLVAEILAVLDPIEECGDACCVHAPGCDGNCDHLQGHRNACMNAGEAA